MRKPKHKSKINFWQKHTYVNRFTLKVSDRTSQWRSQCRASFRRQGRTCSSLRSSRRTPSCWLLRLQVHTLDLHTFRKHPPWGGQKEEVSCSENRKEMCQRKRGVREEKIPVCAFWVLWQNLLCLNECRNWKRSKQLIWVSSTLWEQLEALDLALLGSATGVQDSEKMWKSFSSLLSFTLLLLAFFGENQPYGRTRFESSR